MSEKYYGWGLPIDISTHGAGIDRLIIVLHVFMLILFVGWLGFLLYSLIKFRQRPNQGAQYHTKHFKAPTYLEIAVALTEFVLLFAFSIPLWQSIRYQMPALPNALQVRVVAEQFAWNIHYPGPDGRFGQTDPALMKPTNPVGLVPDDAAGQDDIVTINQLHIPVNTPVTVRLTSKDVIHSFAIPVMRVKQDAIPGQEIKLAFEATKTGNFEIACAQLCGLGHYRMRGFFVVDDKNKFDDWLREETAKKGVA